MVRKFGFQEGGTPVYKQKPDHFGKKNLLIGEHSPQGSRYAVLLTIDIDDPAESDQMFMVGSEAPDLHRCRATLAASQLPNPMKQKSHRRLVVLACASLSACLLGAPPAQAATTAYKIENGGWAGSTGSFVVGFEFSITTSISITHLGVADWFNDGLSGGSQVGLWTNTGTLQTTVTLPAGTGADLVETQANPSVTFYLQQLASPLVLAPGSYVIANQHIQVNGSQVFGYNGATTWSPEITWVRGLAENNGGTTLAFPNDITYNSMSYLGPQFKFDVVPEPTHAALLGVGALGLLIRRRRR